jgi:hypothetical protein
MLRRLGLALLLVAAMVADVGAQQYWPRVEGRGVCLTDPGWCPLPYPEQTPVGAPCYCIMPGNRYVYGLTTADRYGGHVNPFFNLHQTVPFEIKQ